MPSSSGQSLPIGAGREAAQTIARHMDAVFRMLGGHPGAVSTPAYFRLMTGEPHPLGNVAMLADGTSLAQARDAVEPLVTAGTPSAVVVTRLTTTGEVDGYLTSHGFAAQPPLPAMSVDIAALPPSPLADGYDFVRTGTGGEARAWTEALATGYGLPLPLARAMSPETLPADPAPDATMQFFAVRRDGRLVGTSMLVLHEGLAGIYCVATLPEERGKGVGASLTVEPLRRAAAIGYRTGILQSSDAGYSVYRRLGFADHGGIPMYVRIPG